MKFKITVQPEDVSVHDTESKRELPPMPAIGDVISSSVADGAGWMIVGKYVAAELNDDGSATFTIEIAAELQPRSLRAPYTRKKK